MNFNILKQKPSYRKLRFNLIESLKYDFDVEINEHTFSDASYMYIAKASYQNDLLLCIGNNLILNPFCVNISPIFIYVSFHQKLYSLNNR